MDSWIIPCNVKYFDILTHVEKSKVIIWKKSAKIQEGDKVYIYVGTPYKEVKYRCIVDSINVDEQTLQTNSYAIRDNYDHTNTYMKLIVEKEYNQGISMKKLQDLGMFMVRKQTRLYGTLLDYIQSFDQ